MGPGMEHKHVSPDPPWMAPYRADEAATVKTHDALGLVTRLVVEKDGVSTEFWADAWDVHIQDGSKTVKLLARGEGVASARVAAEFLRVPAETVRTAGCSDPAINAAIELRFGRGTLPGA